jgi:flagellin
VISGTLNTNWPDAWNALSGAVTRAGLHYNINASAGEVHFKNFYINEKTGEVYAGDVILDVRNAAAFDAITITSNAIASFTATYVGQTAEGDVKLRDLDKFWDAQGRFLLTDPQTLTVTQGDGKTAKVTIYANDTLNEVAAKLNGAIGNTVDGLGQSRYLQVGGTNPADAGSQFAVFVGENTAEKYTQTDEAVAGTFVIRSIVAGKNGEINFAGDEDLIKALSLNTIHASQENNFTVTINDAHSGNSVGSGSVKITGNTLVGVIDPNVDVEFVPMAIVEVRWDGDQRTFILERQTELYTTTLHLADNTTVFQIGANEGEDMGVNFGDMRAAALGLNGVLVTDRESAARSITIIDGAIDRVSNQRAKLGAYQNRLEHTINNLTVAGENLTAAESRIRDTDMAKEMMNFTKLQIMLQAGTSMLAQANTLPQNVLSLLR